MYDELAQLVEGKVDPSTWDGLLELCKALDSHQAILYKEQLHHLAMDVENTDYSTVVDRTVAIIYGQVAALLAQMHLVFDLDALTHQSLADILNVLLFKPNDQDEEALNALDQGEDGPETLSEILAVYLGTDASEYIEAIHQVPVQTLRTIVEHLVRNIEYGQEVTEGVQEVVTVLNYHQQLTGAVTVGMESLQAGIEPGGDTTAMVEQQRDALMAMKPDELGDALISIVLLAKVSREAVEDEVMHFAEALLDDPVAVQRTYKRVRARMTQLEEFSNEKT